MPPIIGPTKKGFGSEGFSGLDELLADLSRMSEEVQTEAAGIVRATAELMKAEVVASYPTHEGVLRNSVNHEEMAPLRHRVRTRAQHSHLYEFGTVQRFTAGKGANCGTMPAKPTFIPAAIKARARMHRELVDLVKRQKVRGMTGTLEVRGA